MCENSWNTVTKTELSNFPNDSDRDVGFGSDFLAETENLSRRHDFDVTNSESADIIDGKKMSSCVKNDEDNESPPGICAASSIEFLLGKSKFPKDFHELTSEQQHAWLVKNIRSNRKDLPDAVIDLIPPCFRNVDYERSFSEKPEWLDMKKFRKGQKFVQDYYFGVCFAELCSLFMILSFTSGLKALMFTKKSDTPYTAFKRYLSTTLRIRNWFTEDPWTEGTSARNDIKIVRKMHKSVGLQMEKLKNGEIDEASKIDNLCCPLRDALKLDLSSSCESIPAEQNLHYLIDNINGLTKPFNQMGMQMTQFAFVGLIILFPRDFGIHWATREDLEAFCHVWRGIGYLLGIEDQYNFCRGSLDDITQRARDVIEYCIKPNFRNVTPEWEHTMRCIFEGLEYYFPGMTFTTAFLYLGELLDIQLPHVYASLSYRMWIRYCLSKLLLRYTSKLPGVPSYLNMRLNNALNRAKLFDSEKHKELENRSAATILKLSGSFAM